MKLSFETLDVFTTTPYTGNPVAIISVPPELKSSLTQTQKLAIGKEFNLSEIVFLHLPTNPSSTERQIDIFTSYAEVPFAGHPTVGTANYLLNFLKQDVKTITTKAGPIPIEKTPEGGVKVDVPFNFHIHDVSFKSTLVPEQENPTVSIVNGMSFIFVRLPSLQALGKASANITKNGDTYDPSPLDAGWQNGLVGTMYFVFDGTDSQGRSKYRTRMFASREDPGTGSASSALGCWLAVSGEGEKFVFEQGVEMGRRNEILVEVETEGEEGKKSVKGVRLSGRAVKVMEGSLEV
ncbi:phenazine biosynthesis protein-like protein phzf family [Halenospora varia]|nr:phenazine biosynthesis protein-like protein phzf family [Halenospora varia]